MMQDECVNSTNSACLSVCVCMQLHACICVVDEREGTTLIQNFCSRRNLNNLIPASASPEQKGHLEIRLFSSGVLFCFSCVPPKKACG